MPEFTAIFKESFRAEWLVATSTNTAIGMEVLASSNDVPAGDRLATARATRHVLSVAFCAERHAIIILEELCEGEEALTTSVALEALLVPPLAKSHDSIAFVGDSLLAECADHASLLGAVADHLNAASIISNFVTRLKLGFVQSRHCSRSGTVTRRGWWRRGFANRGSAVVAEFRTCRYLGTACGALRVVLELRTAAAAEFRACGVFSSAI